MSDFERELENELHRVIDPLLSATVPPRRVAGSGGTMKRVLGGTGVAIGLKVLTGIAAAAAAVTVAGAATEIATTGSVNPQDWGISHQVQTCKDNLRPGTHGIGSCVSAVARQHGKGASTNGSGQGNGGNAGNGNASGNANGGGNANGHSKTKGENGTGHGKGASGSGSGGSNDSTQQEPTDPSGHAPVSITPAP